MAGRLADWLTSRPSVNVLRHQPNLPPPRGGVGWLEAHGSRCIKPSLSECPYSCCARVCLRHASVFICIGSLRASAFYLSFLGFVFYCFVFLSFSRLFAMLLFLCCRRSCVDLLLILSCPVDHVPDWQPRILLVIVEARPVNVKNTHTHKHTATLHIPPVVIGGLSLSLPGSRLLHMQLLLQHDRRFSISAPLQR